VRERVGGIAEESATSTSCTRRFVHVVEGVLGLSAPSTLVPV
jgi:hypothetical protein